MGKCQSTSALLDVLRLPVLWLPNTKPVKIPLSLKIKPLTIRTEKRSFRIGVGLHGLTSGESCHNESMSKADVVEDHAHRLPESRIRQYINGLSVVPDSSLFRSSFGLICSSRTYLIFYVLS